MTQKINNVSMVLGFLLLMGVLAQVFVLSSTLAIVNAALVIGTAAIGYIQS